ncbi:MAG: oligosaccharide flippase family protein [Verrucomicrobiales bacterium]|nr:oligosaccharide flippase family protein [Verrucomicrobiales bacterium]
MNREEVRRNVVRSTLSGYVRLVVRMGLGLVTFRLLYQGLTEEQFGFWSLLWAIFGYGILLDFGFGYAAQKRVAEFTVREDWDQLSRVLSTIFFFYAGIALVAVLVGIAFSNPLVALFKVSAESRETFRQVLVVFLIGIGLAFPLGIFPEILQGQQRIMTANNLQVVSTVANFVCVGLVVWFKLGFLLLVILSLLCMLIPYVWAAVLAFQRMPGVRLRPGLFSRRAMFDTGRFSLFAYANTLSNVLRNKTDQPVIGSVLGVAAVAPFQAGSKVGEMFGHLTRQIADVLSPTAAHLHARGDRDALRDMLVNGMRFSVLAATPLYIVTAVYMEGVVRLLTGLRNPDPEMLWTGQLLLFWYYSLVLTHWVFKRMFMMAGQEKRMMWQGVTEAAVNLTLSIVLTLVLHSIIGVALGSVIPTFLFGWTLIWGWAAHEAGLGRWALFRRVVLPAWVGCLPMIAVAAAFRLQPWWASGSTSWRVLGEGAFVGAIGLAGIWFLAFSAADRARFTAKLGRRFGAPRKGDPA